MNPLISIIVPVYKVEEYLERCLSSVLQQRYNNWELILVDDGSPDHCPRICDEYASKDSRICVIHKENGGLSSARNVGLDNAKGDYITFLDSDDYLHPDALYDAIHVAISEDADIVQWGFLRGVSSIFPHIHKSKTIEVFSNISIFYSKRQKIIVWAKLYKHHLWNGIKMPLNKLNEDDATTWKLYYRSSKVVYIDTPYYYYTYNPNSIMSGIQKKICLDFIEHYAERIAFFEKIDNKLLADLSRWRFCLPLMLSYMTGNATKSDLSILLDNFSKNYKAALLCSKVRFSHRLLIGLFSCCPQLFRTIFTLLGKAHTLD